MCETKKEFLAGDIEFDIVKFGQSQISEQQSVATRCPTPFIPPPPSPDMEVKKMFFLTSDKTKISQTCVSFRINVKEGRSRNVAIHKNINCTSM